MKAQSKRIIRLAVVQMASVPGEKEKNLRTAQTLLEKESWDLAVLPELFATEFFPSAKDSKLFSYAEPVTGPIVTQMAKIAKKKKAYLVIPFFERDRAGVCYNAAAFVDRKGKVSGVYRKTHIPFTRTYEKYYFSPGSEFPVFQTDFGPVGILICYDRWYPEAWRKLIFSGANVICIPISSWKYQGFSEIPVWEPLLKIRARENLVYVAAANRIGLEGDFSYFGRSAIANPKGEIIGELGENEQKVLIVECDLAAVEQERTTLPFLRDRRPEIY